LQVFIITKEPQFVQSDELIEAVHRCLGADELWFVVPTTLVGNAKAMTARYPFVHVADEGDILTQPLAEIASWPIDGFPERAGWYYQQLVKLALAQSPIARPRYLIWDADTLPCRPLEMFDGDTLVFTRGYEFHRPYFDTNRRLIGVDRSIGPRFSVISQHMPVDKALMLGMLEFIAKASPDGTWVGAIRQALAGREGGSLLSEYELFADWLRVKHPERMVLRRGPWLRNGALLSEGEMAMAKKVAWFIAVEEWDRWRADQKYEHYKLWRNLLRQALFDWMWPMQRFDGGRCGR
jgi:hypothetical protein